MAEAIAQMAKTNWIAMVIVIRGNSSATMVNVSQPILCATMRKVSRANGIFTLDICANFD